MHSYQCKDISNDTIYNNLTPFIPPTKDGGFSGEFIISNKDNKIISHKDIYAETSNDAKEILMSDVKNKYKIYIFDVEEL